MIDIGAAYGQIALEAASRKIPIIANDLDPRHLDITLQRAKEPQRPYIARFIQSGYALIFEKPLGSLQLKGFLMIKAK